MQDIVTLIAHTADVVYVPVKTLKKINIYSIKFKNLYIKTFYSILFSKHSESCK